MSTNKATRGPIHLVWAIVLLDLTLCVPAALQKEFWCLL